MIGSDGLVLDKTFLAEHGTRESVNDMLQETYRVKDVDRGHAQVVNSPYVKAQAYFASPTVRQRQLTVLTVEIELADGIHINGRHVPEGYVPLELTLSGNDDIALERVDYPEPAQTVIQALNEPLPVYTGRMAIKARCIGVSKTVSEQTFQVNVQLRYQACDDEQCYLPETLNIPVSLRFLPHVG